jgi:hypothetical protein
MVSDEDAAEIVRRAETAADAAVALKNVEFALGSFDIITDGGFCIRNLVERIPVEEEHENEEEEDAPQVAVFVPYSGDPHDDSGKKC